MFCELAGRALAPDARRAAGVDTAASSRRKKRDCVGEITCRICGESHRCRIHALTEAVDVYTSWTDECEATNAMAADEDEAELSRPRADEGVARHAPAFDDEEEAEAVPASAADEVRAETKDESGEAELEAAAAPSAGTDVLAAALA